MPALKSHQIPDFLVCIWLTLNAFSCLLVDRRQGQEVLECKNKSPTFKMTNHGIPSPSTRRTGKLQKKTAKGAARTYKEGAEDFFLLSWGVGGGGSSWCRHHFWWVSF